MTLKSIIIYLLDFDMMDSAMPLLSDFYIFIKPWEWIDSKVVVEPRKAIKIGHRKHGYTNILYTHTNLRLSKFILADTETVRMFIFLTLLVP